MAELSNEIAAHAAWLLSNVKKGKRASFRYADLSGADFSKLDLRGADFWRCDLEGADFSNADVGDANFGYANLNKASLWRIRARGANFEGAKLRDADLRGGAFRYAVLRNSDLGGANLGGADLRGSSLDFTNWPLWCGSSEGVRLDRRQQVQLLAHVMAASPDMPWTSELARVAATFHRAGEFGTPAGTHRRICEAFAERAGWELPE